MTVLFTCAVNWCIFIVHGAVGFLIVSSVARNWFTRYSFTVVMSLRRLYSCESLLTHAIHSRRPVSR